MAKKKTHKKNPKTVKSYDTSNICKRIVAFLYIMAVFCVYPLILDNAYFNITVTKAVFFQDITKWFALGFVVGMIADFVIHSYLKHKNNAPEKEKIQYPFVPVIWMGIFMLANVVAWYMAGNTDAARYGDEARYMGMDMYLLIGVMFLCLAYRIKVSVLSVWALAITTIYIHFVGIIQHLELDRFFWTGESTGAFQFLHLRERLNAIQADLYMSTLGNINVFSSYVVMTTAFFMAVLLFTEKRYLKIISGVVVFMGGSSVMAANSDSGFMGIALVTYVLFLISIYRERIKQFLQSLLLMAGGYFTIVLLNHLIPQPYFRHMGIAAMLNKIYLPIAALIILGAILFLVYYLSDKHRDVLDKWNKNKKMIVIGILATTAVAGILFVIIGSVMHLGIFNFNDEWGSFRGFVWSRAWEIYLDAPVLNKLFGYGNESFGTLMEARFYEESLEITEQIYDNAHCEPLQYLITLGALGLVSYIGLFVSSVIYILRYGRNNEMIYGFFAGILGYFIQSLVSLNQPITTPFYFVMMALGVGYASYLRREESKKNKNEN